MLSEEEKLDLDDYLQQQSLLGDDAFIAEPPNELYGYLQQNSQPNFPATLFDFIRRSGEDEVTVYRRAFIDRRHFSKIRSDRDYQPKKETVMAFAIALRLSIDDTGALLASAGYRLSRGQKFDLIIRYFLERGVYSFMKINDALASFDQPVFGA